MGWTDLRVDLLQGLEEGLEGGAAKVHDVNRLRFSTFWKCRSQMYWGHRGRSGQGQSGSVPSPSQPAAQETENGVGRELEAENRDYHLCASCRLNLAVRPPALAI